MRVVAGIGASSGATVDDLHAALLVAERMGEIALIATIDRRAALPALIEVARRRGIPVVGFGPAELDAVPGVGQSNRVRSATGTGSVAEAAALLAAGAASLVVSRTVVGRVTVAAARYAV